MDIAKYILSFFNGFKQIEKLKKENPDFDFALAMWAFPAGLFALWLKIRFKIPYATWSLGSDIYVYGKIPVLKELIRLILRQAKTRFADGIDLKNKVEVLSGKDCIFLPSSSKFEKVKEGKKFSIKKGKKITLCFLGRMEPVKGPDIFLSALIKIKEKLPGFQVHFMGGGSLLDHLKGEAEKEGIMQYISFWGNVNDPEQIAAVLRASDWLVIPSRSDSIPLVFSEAMKIGVPVIAPEHTDLKYLVEKYKVGFTFKTADIDKLADIMKKLSKSSKIRNAFAENTKKAAELFSLEKSAKMLINRFKIKQ